MGLTHGAQGIQPRDVAKVRNSGALDGGEAKLTAREREVAGLIAAGATFAFFNLRWGGIPFRIGFFPVFRIPEASLMWGLAVGSRYMRSSRLATIGANPPALT